jgi:hypothetical protein
VNVCSQLSHFSMFVIVGQVKPPTMEDQRPLALDDAAGLNTFSDEWTCVRAEQRMKTSARMPTWPAWPKLWGRVMCDLIPIAPTMIVCPRT